MDYDLNGERKTKKTIVINHVTYRKWKVNLSEYDMLLQKGTLEASMFELLANVLRQHLPTDVFIHQPHKLRSKRTGPDQLPKHAGALRLQLFPYRSNSKQWCLFLLTKANESYELRVVTPEQFDAAAFDWATTHLRCQYAIRTETTYSSWPSMRGSELLLFLGVAKEVLSDVRISRDAEDSFVAHALDTLRRLREAAVASNVSMLEEVMGEEPVLDKNMGELF